MALTMRGKQVLEFLTRQAASIHHTPIGHALGISRSNVRTVLGKLENEGFVSCEGKGEENLWSITKKGIEELGKVSEGESPPISEEEEETPPATAPAKAVAKTPVEKIDEMEEEPIPPTPAAGKASDKKAPGEEEEEPTLTLSDLGKTPRQIFMNMGVMLGVRRQTVMLAAQMVWAGGASCYDLNWVWKKLTEVQVPYDLRTSWIYSWKAYAAQERPSLVDWEPPTTAQIQATEEKEKAAAKKASADAEPREWLIGANGKPVKVGSGAGMYTFEEAKEVIALDTLKIEAVAAAKAADGSSRSEKISEILEALKPYLTGGKEAGDSGKEKISDILAALAPYITKGEGDHGLLRELYDQKLTNFLSDIESRFGGTGGQGDKEPWYKTLPAMLTSLTAIAPTVRTLLGIPSSEDLIRMIESRIPKGNGAQNYTILDSTGQPMRLDLASILEIKKFEREQSREDDKHKASINMMSGAREFLTRIGSAAQRLAGK